MMTAEVKLYTLAQANPLLRADLGTNPFRWFDVPMEQGRWGKGASCVRHRRVSTVPMYSQGGLMNLEEIRFQFDCMSLLLEDARALADHLTAFMGTVDLTSNAQFGSPAMTPNHAPCFLLNRRPGADYQLKPVAQIISLDFRVKNRTDL